MVSEKVKKLENNVHEALEKYFPKGKDKRRGEALLLIALAKEMGVQGAWDKIGEKDSLMNSIIKYCEKAKIKGSFNNPFRDKLVSFEVKEDKE